VTLNTVIKPERMAAVAAEAVKQATVIPNLITAEGFDQFRGAENDTVHITVPGYLPAREIPAWRAERSSPITLDAYGQRRIAITLGGNTYQATKLQDEQKDFDLMKWSEIVTVQGEGIGRNLERKCVNLVLPYHASTNPKGTPYEVTIGGAVSGRSSGGMRADLIALRRACNKIRMPLEGRTFLMGSGIEEALLADEKIVLSQNTSESTAEGALREARIGRLFQMDLVVSPELPDDFGAVFVRGAYAMATAAPSVPDSIKFGSTASAGGFATVRWMKDYDPTLFVERSVVNLYNGTRYVTDVLFDEDNEDVAHDANGDPFEYMIRAVAFDLDATSDVLPTGSDPRAVALTRITGLGDAA
jgi:hypothetical protein